MLNNSRSLIWSCPGAKTIIEKGSINKNTQILVRIHPLHFRTASGKFIFQDILDEYDRIEKKYPCVKLNTPKMISQQIDFNMDDSEEVLVSSILKYSSVMLNMFSTMAIEAAIQDLPIINVCIQDRCRADIGKSKQDIMVDFCQTHNQRVIQTGGTRTVFTNEELTESIKQYLFDPSIDRSKRLDIVNNEAGPFKGDSGKMIGKYISSLV